jgi:translation initiation factor 2 beta subunit (eIF-2beta)/eIF-5
MLNEINDQFQSLMKHFVIFNFCEGIETQRRKRECYVAHQELAAPAWDNVKNCARYFRNISGPV